MATIHLVSQQLDRGDDRPAPDQAQRKRKRKRKRNDDGGKLLRHASSLSRGVVGEHGSNLPSGVSG